MSLEHIKAGDSLWFVPHGRRFSEPYWITVAKVGRKWLTMKDWRSLRISRKTGWADGGEYMTPGRAWPSREAYESAARTDKAWQNFIACLPGRFERPADLTLEAIDAAAKQLDLKGWELP